jgi:hypothetical protein
MGSSPAAVSWLGRIGRSVSRPETDLSILTSWRLIGFYSSLISRICEICRFPGADVQEKVIAALQWMGLFSDKQVTVRGSLLNALSARLAELISFGPGERDLVMLQHKVVVDWPEGYEVR